MNVTSISKRALSLMVVGMLFAAAMLPLVRIQKASAYGLITSRSIQMSSSQVSATNTIYKLGFTTATTSNIGGMVINFCSNTPILGDTSCTAPTGFDTVYATLALANQSGITGWSVDTTNSTSSTIILTRTVSSISSSTAVSVDLGTGSNGITNPSTTNSTFYARVITYDTAANAQAFSPTAALGSGNVDAGGIAISTANQITITAKVQERLTFCVYTGANCAAGGSAVTLGNTNGVLDFAGPYVDKTTKYDVATNASSGVAIRIKGDTLKNGATPISAIGATAASSSAGSEQFGFCNYQSTGSGLTPASPYADSNCSSTTQTAGTGSTGGAGTAQFAFDTTNTNTTYGQTFANKTAGTTSTGIIAFIGNISATTQAGIYTTTLTFVATGTY